MNTTLSTSLRWVAVLPAAIAAFIISFWLYVFIERFAMGGFLNPDSIVGKFFIDVMSNLIAGAAFILVGTITAPAHQKICSLILAGIVLLVSGALFFIINFLSQTYSSNIGLISMNVGAISTMVSILKQAD